MPSAALGLARVTINTPHRRVDVALPEQIAIAELLPELLQHAGEGFADEGERHGGWVLRRADGTSLAGDRSLHQQNVRDGQVLHLVPARADWPELEYDDVVEAIAEGARRRGAGWSPTSTRTATVVGAGVLLAGGVLAILQGGPGWQPGGWLGLAAAVLLLFAGVVASRAYGDARVGAVLGGFSLPYAFAGGALVLGGDSLSGTMGMVPWLGQAQLLLGAMCVLLFSALGGAGVGGRVRVFTAGVTFGLLTGLTSLLSFVDPAGAAAILLALLVCGIGLVPVLAIRFGKVPVPSVTLPTGQGAKEIYSAGSSPALEAARRLPERQRVFSAVSRSEELLSGMLIGYAVLTVGATAVLVTGGGLAGKVLTGVACVALLLRSRLFVSPRQRVPLLVAGLTGVTVLLVGMVFGADSSTRALIAVGSVAIALIVVVAGQAWSTKPPSPYIGRIADLFEMLIVVSVIPAALWVLDVFDKIQAIAG
ncbi:MAG: type VII secretion integral membrane protein EccD [Hamadaea sp.]|nr:type VII secretion integral membrane protein EccD [Hamadaea sp.]NUR48655.1 type VII secretion integral membrane protein EccD [Hamadaea sp.]NUT03295.1 type VII secretion integral membrane protein EccD [Hamadaea sp.]